MACLVMRQLRMGFILSRLRCLAEQIKEVTADLRALGYATLLLLQDDGKTETGNSHQAFSLQFTVPKTLDPGEYKVRVGVLNIYAGYTGKDITLKVER